MLTVTVNISQAQKVQDIPDEAIGWVEGVAYAVVVKDNYAYVGFGSEFTIVDVSNKTSPVVVATLPLPETIKEIYLADNVAFVVLDMGLWTIDVTNPVASTMLGSYLYPGLARIVVWDSYVYGTSTIYLLIWDVSDQSNPSLLSITTFKLYKFCTSLAQDLYKLPASLLPAKL